MKYMYGSTRKPKKTRRLTLKPRVIFGGWRKVGTFAILQIVRLAGKKKKKKNLTQTQNVCLLFYFTGDETALSTWRHLRSLSISSFAPLYQRLNIRFDAYSGESETEPYIARVHDLLRARGLVTKGPDGAACVDLERWGLGSPIVQRTDGTSLYITRDLASLLMRREMYAFDRAVYVVGQEQERYLKQVFRIAKLVWGEEERAQVEKGHEEKRRRLDDPIAENLPEQKDESDSDAHWSTNLVHVSFGRIHGMSTRRGNVVFLQDILDTARDTMLEIMRGNEDKYDEILEEGEKDEEGGIITGEVVAEKIADTVGASAVVVQDIQGRRAKDYDFSWERMTDAKGDTGVYLQYAYARICG